MKCERCYIDVGSFLDLKVWTITIGDKLETFHVCESCKNKFIDWMENK